MDIHVLVGTTSGNTEYLAEELGDVLKQDGHNVTFHDQPMANEIPQDNAFWLICIATHGAGEYPESIIDFMEWAETEKPDLSMIEGAIVSIGDSSYDTFAEAGKSAQKLFTSLGMTLKQPTLTIDMLEEMDPDQAAIDWLNRWKSVISG